MRTSCVDTTTYPYSLVKAKRKGSDMRDEPTHAAKGPQRHAQRDPCPLAPTGGCNPSNIELSLCRPSREKKEKKVHDEEQLQKKKKKKDI
jgi:hypothetical protein